MKIFLLRVIMFFIPVVIFLLIPFSILKLTGENFYDIDNIDLSKKEYLVGYNYNESNYKNLKYNLITKQDKAKIMALGSSRVLQFRKEMFNVPFYNAGFIIEKITDFESFLRLLPENKLPKYLILGMDQWMFNRNWDLVVNNSFDKREYLLNESHNFSKGLNNFKLVYRDIFSKKINKKVFDRSDKYIKIGLNATLNSTGFRNDGSFLYQKQIEKLLANDTTSEDYLFKDTFKRIRDGNRRFEFATDVNPKAIVVLDSLLSFCYKRSIKVIGFLPPFSNEVNNKMDYSNKYKYLDDIFPNVKKIMDKYDYEVYDFTNVSSLDIEYVSFIDGFHASEKTYLRMLIEILNSDSCLNEVCEVKKLKKDIKRSVNNYSVYNY